MAVQFGTIVNGQTVSSAFTLAASDRVLVVGVSSHAALLWYASFQGTPGGPFLRYLDPYVTSGTLFAGTGGAWAPCHYPPSTVVRIETSAAVSATTSF